MVVAARRRAVPRHDPAAVDVEDYSLYVGELTINGVTNAVEIAIEAHLVNEMILITGTTEVVLTGNGPSSC